MAVETGSDINNLEFSPMELTIPMALIPCGTGFRSKANICSVCSEGRLLSYSVLLVGYGVWGDIIYAAETKRHLGVLRYPASFLSLLFGRFRTLKLKIDIKAPLEFQECNSATMAYLEQPTASGINSKGKETDIDTPGQDSEPEPKKSDVSEQRAHHTEEILAIYDLSSIDGIAVVGGDGLYHEAANGLIRRMAADTGGDVNDPNFWPPEFPVAIAIIPCGTGNGIAREQMGNFDIATAVYAAVLGFRSKKNISRVFSNGKLISYSILLVGYGLWGDIIYTSETRRHWGVMRYPANLARIKELTDTQNKSPQGQETDVDNIGSVTNVADSESTKTYQAGFSTIEGRFTGVVMLAEMMSLSCNPSKPHEQDRVTNVSHVFLSKPGGKLQYLKLLYKMYSRDSEIDSNTPACLTVFTADELKLRLMDPHDETSDQGRKERILNIDGDIHLLERTEFHVKLFPERIPMFCNIPVFTG
ncbi:hypothetical protein DPMN_142530 [Dreissena polymorpha]|uniref:DAGKc domain-containing protein n=1 Tax=Dreissena polymorpha TaxID=45954 RepID=A0A9D4GHF6_DREPO|nr:hypothetical protein DPMN_142530 [Dreissena polymorpha]